MARERERSREHRERERVGRQRTREKRDSSHHRVSSPRRARNKSCTETARWNSREARVRYHSNVAVSWSTEQENANDNNANFGDWIEVSRKRRKRAEENSSRVVGNGKQRRYKNLHRRDHEDVTTFYFSRFPDGTRETDLWKIFQKWGRVREVFIPKYKNKEGHKFGFVRFKEVMDERRLERDLDNNIFIDGMKLFVNRPKFDRGRVFRAKPFEEPLQKMPSCQEKHNGKQLGDKAPCYDGEPRSYLDVVKETTRAKGSSYLMKEDPQGDTIEIQRLVVLNSTKEDREWLEKAWIGRLKNRGMFEKLEEELRWVVDREVNPCYWGDDWIILPGMDESNANRWINAELKNGSTPIMDLQKWSPDIRPEFRLTWVLLRGLPLSVWKPEYMKKVMEDIGEMVEVDDYVEERRRMDVARTLIRTNQRLGFHESVRAMIDGEEHQLTVVEDMSSMGAKMKSYQNHSWFPPSPVSTPPNTPLPFTDDTPGRDSGNDDSGDSDAELDGADTGTPNHWHNSRLSKRRPSKLHRDHWVKPHGRSPSVRSISDVADVDHSKVVNAGGNSDLPRGVDSELHNGHITHSGKACINEGESQKWTNINIVSSSQKNDATQEGRAGQTYEEKKESSTIDAKGDREEVWPIEKGFPHRVHALNIKEAGANFHFGRHAVNEAIGEVGLKIKGPIKSATKVYVRRKEVQLSHGKAQYSQGPDVESVLVPEADHTLAVQGDKIDQELSLIRDLGLTYGGDDKEIKEILKDMDNKDTMKAAAMGIKNQIL